MDKIVDIPVKDHRGRLIGKASVTREGENYSAQMVLDPQLGGEMVEAMSHGTITGLSVGVEISPVMKAGAHFFQGRADYGKGPSRVSLPTKIGNEEIELRFGHHKASIEGPNATAPIHEILRSDFKFFAQCLDHHLPTGREKNIAFDRLEDASMWSHKSIARISAGQDG